MTQPVQEGGSLRSREGPSRRTAIGLAGSLVGQGIAVACLPLISRYYSPEVTGDVGRVVAWANIAGVAFLLQLDQAVVAAKREDVVPLMASALGGCSLLVLGTTAAMCWFQGMTALRLGLTGLLMETYCVMLLLSAFALRRNRITSMAVGRVGYYGGGALLQAAAGAAHQATVEGYVLAQLAAAAASILCVFPWPEAARYSVRRLGQDLAVRRLRKALGANCKFIIYQLPAAGLNVLSVQLPIIILRGCFAAAWAGYYFMSFRILAGPSALVSQAVGQLFYRDAAERARRKLGNAAHLRETVSGLLGLSVLPSAAAWCAAPLALCWILGEQWRPAVAMFQLMLISVAMGLVVSPVSYLVCVFDRQDVSVTYNLALLVVRLAGFGVGIVLRDAVVAVALHSVGSAVVLLLFLRATCRVAGISLRAVLRGGVSDCAWAVVAICAASAAGRLSPVWGESIGAGIGALLVVGWLLTGKFHFLLRKDRPLGGGDGRMGIEAGLSAQTP